MAIKYLDKIIKKEQRRLKKSSFWNNELYYLKIDFSKYFFSINHDFLKQKIEKYIKNEEVLYCIDLMLSSYKTSKNYNELLFENDFYINEKDKWLPIWWIVSQLFANFYLNDLDQFLKHNLKVKFVRYMDDVLILWDKEKLNYVKKEIFKFVVKEKLILNPKKTSFNLVSDWISFVWYKLKDNKIFAWKRIKKSFLKFSDSLIELEKKNLKLTSEDISRLSSMYYSRTWCFKITNFWENFIKKRENIDFLRGGNANNTSNTGVFALNLNRNSTNQNRNVGFRCSQ
jgi:RNA-directed DNA polymerase